jgi:hypothetical protein
VTSTRSRSGDADLVPDPVLAAAVEVARVAVRDDAGPETVGGYVGVRAEPGGAATHLFQAVKPGYGGWRWAVTVAAAGLGEQITISEIVLLPGPEALVAPDWLPWNRRIRAGDLGPGDLLPTGPDDLRLVPAYLESDDPAVEDTAMDLGLGRRRVMSRDGRLAAAHRWQAGDYGPAVDMARQAPGTCGTCGFYLPVAGSMRAAFGACANEFAPADGHVVHVEYGCGAHSEAEVESVPPVPVAEVIYDDGGIDVVHDGDKGVVHDGDMGVVRDGGTEADDVDGHQVDIVGPGGAVEGGAAEVLDTDPAGLTDGSGEITAADGAVEDLGVDQTTAGSSTAEAGSEAE